MKHIKENRLQIYKLSDLGGSWRNPGKEEWDKIDTSHIDKKIPLILDTLSKHGIGIIDISNYEYLNPKTRTGLGILFPSEINSIEYRISLGRIITLESILDVWGIDSVEDFDKENINYEDFKEDLERVGEMEEARNRVEFSVMSPKRLKIDDMYIQSYLITLAMKYLSDLIVSYKGVIFDHFDYHDASRNMDGFKSFLNRRGEKINNKNLEFFPVIEYRLYKDNKFFYNVRKEFFNDNEERFKSFLQELYNNFK
jgi:hypothetical protein